MAAREHKQRKERGHNPSCSVRALAALKFDGGHASPFVSCAWCISWLLLFFSAFLATAQTNPPPVSYFRSYVNDIPDQPLVTVTVTGASNVSCLTIEEDLPSPASPVNISGDGVWLPAIGAIRWGPYFNTVTASVSYRLTGLPASYPVNGGAWMDGQWYFSPGVTMVTVLPPGGGGSVPAPPPQVAPPTFAPVSGASVPTNVTISCTTTGAAIYYTLDGTLPTQGSTLYTGAVYLASASTVRAVGFTNSWTPSVASVAYYGPPAAAADAQVTRSVNTNPPTAPVVTFNVVPGTNATCVAVTESLPLGLSATNITAGGSYIASNNVVLWGPIFGTNAQALSYQAVGQPGSYAVRASWSVDGVGGGEAVGTNIVVASATGSGVPTPPPQVAAPIFSPASGSNVPVSVTISCATTGAAIYYTLDGSLPTQASTLYTGAVYLASASTIRAVCFTNGWTPSVASVAYYGAPAAPANAEVTRSVDVSEPTAPVVTFSVTPGAGASCVAVTESLPPGLAVTGVTAGGNYIASNNVVVWGPFFGSNALALSYQAVGQPGTYPVRATWSVDGVGGGEAVGTNLVVFSSSGGFPTPPPQEPVPTLTPAVGSNLPVNISISSSDPQAQIHFTTDGSLPTQSSAPYTSTLTFDAPTTLRAVGYRAGYLPSASAVGNYVASLPANSVSLVRNISGDGTVLPSITISATPLGSVNCYAVTETIVPGLTPSGLTADAVWNPANNTICWGPFLDNQPRALTYQVSGPAGTFPLAGQGSFDGHPATVTGATAVTFNPTYVGPSTNYASCVTGPISYTVDVDPAPGVIVVDTASGTLNWGDGTQAAITQPEMTLQKQYSAGGTYTITLAVSWTGHTATSQVSGNGTKSDTVEVYSSCNPVITNQPSNQVVLLGTTAEFAVGASSEFPLSYQWYFNQTNPIVSPPTFATLTLPDVTVLEAGLYSVVVSSAYGSATSSVAALTVVTPLVSHVARNSNGSVTLGFVGLPNTTTRIWAATNLVSPIFWQPIFTNSLTTTNGTWQFIDTNAPGYPARFYRFSTP